MERFDQLIGIIVVAIGLVVGISFLIVPETRDSMPVATQTPADSPSSGELSTSTLNIPLPLESWRLPEQGSDGDAGPSPALFPNVSPKELEAFKPPAGLPEQSPPPNRDQAAASSEASDPSDIWFSAFSLLQEGEEEMKNGQTATGLEKLKRSKELFDQLKNHSPDFYPELIRYRRENLAAIIGK